MAAGPQVSARGVGGRGHLGRSGLEREGTCVLGSGGRLRLLRPGCMAMREAQARPGHSSWHSPAGRPATPQGCRPLWRTGPPHSPPGAGVKNSPRPTDDHKQQLEHCLLQNVALTHFGWIAFTEGPGRGTPVAALQRCPQHHHHNSPAAGVVSLLLHQFLGLQRPTLPSWILG